MFYNVPLLYAVVNELKITKTNKDGFKKRN